MVTQLASKGIAAVAQLYAIYVFSKIHAPNDAVLMFILLGYGIWIQIFEFGLSQVIQNSLNSRVLCVAGACQIIALHYALMIIVATLVTIFPEVLVRNNYVRVFDVLSRWDDWYVHASIRI